jgi:MioC protein
MRILILVGTVTGTAASVAQAIAMEAGVSGLTAEVRPMDEATLDVFEQPQTLFLICTSTHGAGDVPDNARRLFDALALQPRFLGHVRYGVLGLGDRAGHGATFCEAALQFDARLSDLGARRVGEVHCLDAAEDPLPEPAGVEWFRTWLPQARSQMP